MTSCSFPLPTTNSPLFLTPYAPYPLLSSPATRSPSLCHFHVIILFRRNIKAGRNQKTGYACHTQVLRTEHQAYPVAIVSSSSPCRRGSISIDLEPSKQLASFNKMASLVGDCEDHRDPSKSEDEWTGLKRLVLDRILDVHSVGSFATFGCFRKFCPSLVPLLMKLRLLVLRCRRTMRNPLSGRVRRRCLQRKI